MVEDDLLVACPLHNGHTALTLLYDMRILLHHKFVFVLLEERLKIVKRLHGSSSNDSKPTFIDYLGEFSTLKAEDLDGYSFRVLPL